MIFDLAQEIRRAQWEDLFIGDHIIFATVSQNVNILYEILHAVLYGSYPVQKVQMVQFAKILIIQAVTL